MALTTYTLTTASQTGASITLTEDFDLSISGTFTGIITMQRSFDSGVTWKEVSIFTRATEGTVSCTRTALYRFITSSGYVGSVTIITANNV